MHLSQWQWCWNNSRDTPTIGNLFLEKNTSPITRDNYSCTQLLLLILIFRFTYIITCHKYIQSPIFLYIHIDKFINFYKIIQKCLCHTLILNNIEKILSIYQLILIQFKKRLKLGNSIDLKASCLFYIKTKL